MKWVWVAVVLLLVVSPVAAHDEEDLRKILPIVNVWNPETHKNEPIWEYTFEEIDEYMHTNPRFWDWNDIPRMCESMIIVFGRQSTLCPGGPQYVSGPQYGRSTSRAYVSFELLPPPPPPPRPYVAYVDPVYPPWRPVYHPQYRPYRPWW